MLQMFGSSQALPRSPHPDQHETPQRHPAAAEAVGFKILRVYG